MPSRRKPKRKKEILVYRKPATEIEPESIWVTRLTRFWHWIKSRFHRRYRALTAYERLLEEQLDDERENNSHQTQESKLEYNRLLAELDATKRELEIAKNNLLIQEQSLKTFALVAERDRERVRAEIAIQQVQQLGAQQISRQELSNGSS